MRFAPRLFVVCAMLLATAPIVGAPTSRAQCTITGPTQLCPGDSIELCGPPLDNVSYLWQGPDGTLYMTDCIFAFDPGLYTLTVRDLATRVWSAPCSLTVQSGRLDSPAITGPASTCAGTPASLCGPSGNLEYAWSGPGGFTASSACVSVAAAGDYTLRVRPLPAGCWGDSALHPLAVTNCGGSSVNCPRPAWWWALQCVARDHSRSRLGQSQLASVAGCVDDRSVSLSWTDDAAGFTRTMVHDRLTLALRARRQFAAVCANVCAGQLGLVPRSGPPVALDPATPMDATLGGGTVASWLTFADGELSRLSRMSDRTRSVKESYKNLIRTAWHINHGLGIGTTCRADLVEDTRLAADEGMTSAAQLDIEPLDGELLDDSAGPLELGVLQPNPFSSQTALAFAVSTTASASVSIAVYDVGGRMVRELVSGVHAPGQYEVHWDGTGSDGTRVKSGLYFIRGRIGSQQVQSRVSFIR